MVKSQTILDWVQKVKLQRFAKTVTDTQSLLSCHNMKKNYTQQICKICSEPGTVLACAQCLSMFHLCCLQISPLDLPLSKWPCSECSESYEENFLNILSSSLDSQNEEKTKWLKKFKIQLKKLKKPSKLKKFQKNFPGLVKHGEILYPIDDSLLWSQPELHKLTFTEFPTAHYPGYPSEYTADLILICDFLHSFQQLFHGPSLNCELLYETLAQNTESSLSKDLHISLLKPLTRIMLKSESFRKTSMFHYLIYKSKKSIKIEKALEFSYLTFLQFLFTTTVFKDQILDIDEECFNFFHKISFVEDYYTVSAKYKIKLLVLVVCLILETTVLNEECLRRLESCLRLKKELSEIKSCMKNKKIPEAEKVDLNFKYEEIRANIRASNYRTLPIGQDRYNRSYYIFPWDTSKVYLIPYTTNIIDSPIWSYFCYKTQVSGLISALNEKGVKEKALLQSLRMPFGCSELIYSPKYPLHSLETLKNSVKNLHLVISQALHLNPSSSYIKSIDQSDCFSLIPLITNFHQAFSVGKQSDSIKVSKKIFSLWDYCSLNGVWESSLKECKNYSEIFLCMHLLSSLVSKFNSSEQLSEVTESAYSVARRSYQQERQNKLKKDLDKDIESPCFICGDFGLVICCEKCPKVAHLHCLHLKTLPEGDWLCPTCSFSTSSARSNQIKY